MSQLYTKQNKAVTMSNAGDRAGEVIKNLSQFLIIACLRAIKKKVETVDVWNEGLLDLLQCCVFRFRAGTICLLSLPWSAVCCYSGVVEKRHCNRISTTESAAALGFISVCSPDDAANMMHKIDCSWLRLASGLAVICGSGSGSSALVTDLAGAGI